MNLYTYIVSIGIKIFQTPPLIFPHYHIFDLVVQTRFRVNRRARSYLYRCKKVKLRCKLSDTKKVSSYMISHIDIQFTKYTSIIQKYWYGFKSSFYFD